MSNLEISVETKSGNVPVTVINISGDIDANSHQDLDAKAEELIKGGARHILLNLSDNNYMSSAGFRSMHKIYTALKDTGDKTSSVKLVKPTEEIKRLMKAMGFEMVFQVFEDLDEAVKAF